MGFRKRGISERLEAVIAFFFLRVDCRVCVNGLRVSGVNRKGFSIIG